MKITTLIENLVYQQELVAEHGLSIYVETNDSRILFDTGQSGLFLQNALSLGIPVEEIDTVVLSHGHLDHTGGLYPFLAKNIKAKVYAKKELFTPKYNAENHFNGTHKNEMLLRDRLVYVDTVTEIAEDIFIMPDIPIYNPANTFFKGFKKQVNDQLVADEFDDELFVAIRKNEQINILTACSHRGIINICTTATDHFKLPVNLILGGFHTKNSTAEQFEQLTDYFRILNPRLISVCHCTGVEKYAAMTKALDVHIFYNTTGTRINIG